MLMIATVLVAFAVTSAPPACGAPTSTSEVRVHNLLSVARTPAFASSAPQKLRGLADVNGATVRLLNDSADRTVCRRLRASVMRGRTNDRETGRPLLMTAYAAGSYYFVTLSPDWPPAVPGSRAKVTIGERGDGRLIVFDAGLNLLVETRG